MSCRPDRGAQPLPPGSGRRYRPRHPGPAGTGGPLAPAAMRGRGNSPAPFLTGWGRKSRTAGCFRAFSCRPWAHSGGGHHRPLARTRPLPPARKDTATTWLHWATRQPGRQRGRPREVSMRAAGPDRPAWRRVATSQLCSWGPANAISAGLGVADHIPGVDRSAIRAGSRVMNRRGGSVPQGRARSRHSGLRRRNPGPPPLPRPAGVATSQLSPRARRRSSASAGGASPCPRGTGPWVPAFRKPWRSRPWRG